MRERLAAFQRSRTGQFLKKMMDDRAPNLAILLAWGDAQHPVSTGARYSGDRRIRPTRRPALEDVPRRVYTAHQVAPGPQALEADVSAAVAAARSVFQAASDGSKSRSVCSAYGTDMVAVGLSIRAQSTRRAVARFFGPMSCAWRWRRSRSTSLAVMPVKDTRLYTKCTSFVTVRCVAPRSCQARAASADQFGASRMARNAVSSEG